MELFELIQTLNRAHGPSGDEGEIREVIRALAEPYADEITADTMGSLIVHRRGKGPKLLLAAHMDSIGFVVTHIEKEGFLRVGRLGGVSPKEAAYTPVRFKSGLRDELKKDDFLYVVPDFRLNKVQQLENLLQKDMDKVEFLCNECCFIGCLERKKCYETVSRQNLGEDCLDHVCKAPNSHEGYRFSKAMQNSSFISVEDIQNNYLPKGFSQFKIEGRSLGSALVLEFLLYYMVKPEYQIHVREAIYLDNMLDLF